jgi:hypothetical protein
MPTYSIYVVNNLVDCDTYVSQQVTVTGGCETFIIKLPTNSDAEGPFSLYVDDMETAPIESGITQSQLISGVEIELGSCP